MTPSPASPALDAKGLSKERIELVRGSATAADDDAAVDRFADAMKAKLKWEREQRGRGGWRSMSADDLSRLLYEHLPKGGPLDVANLALMLHQNGQRLSARERTEPEERAKAADVPVELVRWTDRLRHACAASNLHDFDGCDCSATELDERWKTGRLTLPISVPLGSPMPRETTIAAISVELEKSGRFDDSAVKSLVWAARIYDVLAALDTPASSVVDERMVERMAESMWRHELDDVSPAASRVRHAAIWAEEAQNVRDRWTRYASYAALTKGEPT